MTFFANSLNIFGSARIQQSAAITVGISLAVGSGIAYGGYKIMTKFILDQQPKKWVKVGELDKIFCFPVKSCAPIELTESFCGQIGQENGHIRDRVFMVTRLNGEYVTARVYPKMVLIKPVIEGDTMTLSAPDMENLVIDIEKLYESNTKKIQTWFKDIIDVVDCGDEIAEWMSRYLLGEESGLRVVFYPSRLPKPKVQKRKRPFPAATRLDQGALQDETSFLLMSQSSIDDLNQNLDKKVTALRFRPNFVVRGSEAWAEDNWKWIKIGETVFKTVQPCTRCVFTNIDPESGERSAEGQPLKTLQKMRTFKEKTGPTPWFGMQLGVRQMGKVSLGESVYVSE